jgi:hypothetical protein
MNEARWFVITQKQLISSVRSLGRVTLSEGLSGFAFGFMTETLKLLKEFLR